MSSLLAGCFPGPHGSIGGILATILPASSPSVSAAETAPVPAANNDVDEPEAQAVNPAPDADDPASDDENAAAPASIPIAKPSAIPSEIPTLARVNVPTPVPTTILPPDGLKGAQNLLELYASAGSAPFWDEAVFSLADGSWRLGRGASQGNTIFQALQADLLDRSYGNDAPARISRLEAELALHSTDPALAAEDVYFGILLQNAESDNRAGIQIQQISPNVISLALYKNGEADFISQRSVNNLITRLRLDRDPSTGAVSAFFNDSPIGDPIDFAAADAPLEPVILRQRPASSSASPPGKSRVE